MKKIEAIVSPNAVASVVDLLNQQSISNFIITDIMARDSVGARTQMYRGFAYAVDLSPEIKVEAVVMDNQASATAYAILSAARGPDHSFKPRITITPVTEVIVELSNPSSRDFGEQRPRLNSGGEEVRYAAAPFAAIADRAMPSAWTSPLHFAKRITTILAGYLRGGRPRAGAPRTGAPSHKSRQYIANSARASA